MKASRTPFLVLCLTAALLVPASAASARRSGNPARDLAHQINDFRAANGAPKLRISRSLSRSSYRYARQLIQADRFSHSSRIQASRRFRMLGEVLAFQRGWRVRRKFPLGAWQRSGGHRTTLLSRGYRYIGVGRAKGRFGGRLTTIWVAQVGRR